MYRKGRVGVYIHYNFAPFKSIKMRHLFLILLMVCFGAIDVAAQEIKEIEGLFYREGLLYSGPYVTHYPNGKIKMEMNLKKGKKNGDVRLYFENGSLNEIRSFQMNEMHGQWQVYNADGILISEARYKKGMKHGTWIIRNEHGTLLYELHYKKGEKTGTWRSYDDQGKLINEREYKD